MGWTKQVWHAPAKVNLTLHITGKRADGYHELDSLVVFSDALYDELHFEPAEKFSLEIQNAPDTVELHHNSVTDAVEWFKKWSGKAFQAKITLTKRIPTGAGLGGGSSDCATTIRALCEILEIAPPQPEELVSLGADVPVCFYGKPCRMRGIGEKITPIEIDKDYILAIAYPDQHVSTKEIFASSLLKFSQPNLSGSFSQQVQNGHNDMQAAAIATCPEIANLIELMQEHGGEIARMSGSGSAIFGLFDESYNEQKFTKNFTVGKLNKTVND